MTGVCIGAPKIGEYIAFIKFPNDRICPVPSLITEAILKHLDLYASRNEYDRNVSADLNSERSKPISVTIPYKIGSKRSFKSYLIDPGKYIFDEDYGHGPAIVTYPHMRLHDQEQSWPLILFQQKPLKEEVSTRDRGLKSHKFPPPPLPRPASTIYRELESHKYLPLANTKHRENQKPLDRRRRYHHDTKLPKKNVPHYL
jgi:hypothetical protein